MYYKQTSSCKMAVGPNGYTANRAILYTCPISQGPVRVAKANKT